MKQLAKAKQIPKPLSPNKQQAAYVRYLLDAGWCSAKIEEKLGASYNFVYRIRADISHAKVKPMRPPFLDDAK